MANIYAQRAAQRTSNPYADGVDTAPVVVTKGADEGAGGIDAFKPAAKPQVDNFATAMTKVVQNTPERLQLNLIGRPMEAIGELAGSEGLARFAGGRNQALEQELEANAPNVESGLAQYGVDVGRGTMDFLPSLVGKTAGSVISGLQVGSEEYAQSRKEGESALGSLKDAVVKGAIEGVTERIPLGVLLEGGKTALKRLVGGTVSEGAQEAVVDALSQVYDNWDDEGLTLGEAIANVDPAQVGYSALVGGGVGATISAPAHLAAGLSQSEEEERPEPGTNSEVSKPDPNQTTEKTPGVTTNETASPDTNQVEEINKPDGDEFSIDVSDFKGDSEDVQATEQDPESEKPPAPTPAPSPEPETSDPAPLPAQENGSDSAATDKPADNAVEPQSDDPRAEKRKARIFTPKGEQVETEYQVVEVDDVITSHDAHGSVNDAFPSELQPRDRSRSAAKAQAREIAANLQFDMMAESPTSDSGSPIVGPDGIAESGNGRTIATKLSYDEGRADEYKARLIEQAEKYGIDPAEAAKLKRPMLVRVRTSDIDRKKFAEDSNKSAVSTQSPAELAARDREKLNMAQMTEGDTQSASNREFVRDFINSLSSAESAGMRDEKGRPTRQAYDRLNNAIFSAAYESERLIKMQAEEANPDVRNVLHSLTVAARSFAQARSQNADMAKQVIDEVIQATEIIKSAKDRNMKVQEYVKQTALFGEDTDFAKGLAVTIADNNRSPKRLGLMLSHMADIVSQNAAHAASGDMFGDNELTTDRLVDETNKRTKAEQGEKAAQINVTGRSKDADAGGDSKGKQSESEGAADKSVKLYRGQKPGGNKETTGDALFFSEDKSVAESYAGEDGEVIELDARINNSSEHNNWMEAKSAFGIPSSSTMAELIDTARNAGHDFLVFNTKNGKEYVQLNASQSVADEGPAMDPGPSLFQKKDSQEEKLDLSQIKKTVRALKIPLTGPEKMVLDEYQSVLDGIAKHKAAVKDWASREYKSSGGKTYQGTDAHGDYAGTKSVDAANERRRDSRIKVHEREIDYLEKKATKMRGVLKKLEQKVTDAQLQDDARKSREANDQTEAGRKSAERAKTNDFSGMLDDLLSPKKSDKPKGLASVNDVKNTKPVSQSDSIPATTARKIRKFDDSVVEVSDQYKNYKETIDKRRDAMAKVSKDRYATKTSKPGFKVAADQIAHWNKMLGQPDMPLLDNSGVQAANKLGGSTLPKLNSKDTAGIYTPTYDVMLLSPETVANLGSSDPALFSRAMETLSHEYGHSLQHREFYNASDAVKEKVLQDYDKWLQVPFNKKWKKSESRYSPASREEMRKLFILDGKEISETRDTTLSHEYINDFEEWFADMVANAIVGGSVKGQSDGSKLFFKTVADKLRKFYESIKAQFHVSKGIHEFIADLRTDSVTIAPQPKPQPKSKQPGDDFELTSVPVQEMLFSRVPRQEDMFPAEEQLSFDDLGEGVPGGTDEPQLHDVSGMKTPATQNPNPAKIDSRMLFSKNDVDAKQLRASHNLSLANLMHSISLGGIPAPSIAIHDKDRTFDNFGEITLVPGKDLIDPESSKFNHAFGADAYTPRYPSVTNELGSKAIHEFADEYDALKQDHPYLAEHSPYLDSGNERDADTFARSKVVKLYYLTKVLGKNVPVAKKTVKKPAGYTLPELRKMVKGARNKYELMNQESFTEATRKHLESYYRGRMGKISRVDEAMTELLGFLEEDGPSRNEEEAFAGKVFDYLQSVDSVVYDNQSTIGNVSKIVDKDPKYEQWAADKYAGMVKKSKIYDQHREKYLEHNLQNVVKAMTKKIRAGEGFFYGAGSVRALSTRRFKSIDQMRAHRDKLMKQGDDFEPLKEKANGMLQELVEAGSRLSTGVQMRSEDISDAVESGNVPAFMRREFGIDDGEYLAEVGEFLDFMKDMPTEYFEVKVARAVDLSEFEAAAVPRGKAYDEAAKKLKAAGVKVNRYSKKEGDHKRATDKIGEKLDFQKLDGIHDVVLAEKQAWATQTDRQKEIARTKFSPPRGSKLSAWINRAREFEASKSARARFRMRFNQGVVDRYSSLLNLDKKAHGADVVADSIQSSSWVLARMSNAATTAMTAMVEGSRIKFNPKTKVIEADLKTDSLQDVLGQLGDSAEIDRFLRWITGNRAEKLMSEGRENLFTNADIRELKALNTGDIRGQSRAKLYSKTLKEFNEFRRDVLEIGKATGTLNRQWADAFANDAMYVPFYRAIDEQDKAGGPHLGGDRLAPTDVIKELIGGTDKLEDLMTNVLRNYESIISQSLKNVAVKQAVENAQAAGIAHYTDKGGTDTVAYFVDGERVYHSIGVDPNLTFKTKGDKRLAETEAALVLEAINMTMTPPVDNKILNILAAPKRVFTAFTTLTPQFMLANTLRDALSVISTSHIDKNFIKNSAQGFKAYGMGAEHTETRIAMLAGGGAFGNRYDADRSAIVLRTQKDADKFLSKLARNTWGRYDSFLQSAENSSRAAAYLQTMERTGGDTLAAAFEARDVVDFSVHGAFPAVRFLIKTVPFLNARIQGLDKLYRSGVKPTFKGNKSVEEKRQAKRFTAITGALIATTLLLRGVNALDEDEEVENLPQWHKDMYWSFRVPWTKSIVSLPKPFEIGAIATAFDRMVEYGVSDDPRAGAIMRESIGRMLMDTFNLDPTPQAFNPAIEVWANKDKFRQSPIERPWESDRPAYLRGQDNSSRVGIWASRQLHDLGVDVSPPQLDHLLRGYFSAIGGYGLGITDATAQWTSGIESPDKPISEHQPIRRFYRNTNNPTSTRFGNEFYDALEVVVKAAREQELLLQTGDLKDRARALDIISDSGTLAGSADRFKKLQRAVGKINKRIRAIQSDKKMDGAEKRKQIDKLKETREQYFKVGSDAYKMLLAIK